MGTIFSTRGAGNSSQGHYFCQLFVTDKGLIYVVPMEYKKEATQYFKNFDQDIRHPDTIVADMTQDRKYQSLQKLCNDIGTTL